MGMSKWWIAGGAIAWTLLAVAPATARRQYSDAFFKLYQLNPQQGVFQGKACLVCHIESANKARGWNQYGKDFAVALGDVVNAQDEAQIVAALRKIEEKVSSVTKARYVDRIRQGTFPAGDP